MPIYSIGSIYALILFPVAVLFEPTVLLPIIIASHIVIELIHFSASDSEREKIQQAAAKEEREIEQRIQMTEEMYDSMVCIGSYNSSQQFMFQRILKQFTQDHIPYVTKPGIMTNLLVLPEDEERALIVIDQLESGA